MLIHMATSYFVSRPALSVSGSMLAKSPSSPWHLSLEQHHLMPPE